MTAEFTDPAAAAERAAALTGLLTGGQPAGAAEVSAVLREFGEPEPIVLTDADLAGLRRVAATLRAVFAAPFPATAGGSPRRYCSARCASRARVTAYRARSETPRSGP